MGEGQEFPSELGTINDVTLHPRLLRAVAQLLQTKEAELRLQESSAWGKAASAEPRPAAGHPPMSNQDQRMHMDYPNMYLTHPPRWHEPDSVECICYYGDVERCGGPTHVVPREGADDEAYRWPYISMPGTGVHRFINDRATVSTTAC